MATEARAFGESSCGVGRGEEVRKSVVLHCAAGGLVLTVVKKNRLFFEIITDSHAVVRNQIALMHSFPSFSQS